MLKFVLYDFFLYFHFYIKYFLSINQYLMSQTNAQHWLIRPKEKMLHDWRERERSTNQSMRIGCEFCWAWTRIWSSCSESLISSISNSFGLDKSGHIASTRKFLLLILPSLFLLPTHMLPQLLLWENKYPLPLTKYCGHCWSFW